MTIAGLFDFEDISENTDYFYPATVLHSATHYCTGYCACIQTIKT